MLKDQICASSFVINDRDELLLIYHKKFNRYIQPGGHVEGKEELWQTASREVFEETGIIIDIVDKNPFAREVYDNNVGHQIDYQFYAIPKNLDINNNDESFKAGWFSVDDIDSIPVVDDIKEKFLFILEKYRKRGECSGKRKNLNK